MVELEHARELLGSMGLETAATLLDAQMERSLHAEHTYAQFLNELLTSEQQERGRKGEEMRTKLSRLPSRKSLEKLGFSFQPSIDKRQIDELAALAFAARAENVILLGPPGVGKTHLAVGISMKALKTGLTVYCTSLARLIEDLKRALEQNRLERRWRVYLRPAILVIDEVGYMQLNRQEAELFFRLVSERYEHGSIILTSNKYFSDWDELLSDTVIATTLLDRLLHHAHMINIRGQAYRLKGRRPDSSAGGYSGGRVTGDVGHFRPAFWVKKVPALTTDSCITREQLAVILYHYAKYKGCDVSVGEDTNILSYKDALSTSEYAYSALQWACGAGIIHGDDNGYLNPQNSATRAKAAAMLQRFVKNVVG